MSTASLVQARGLVKRFPSLTAVDGVDFDVRKGEAFGFLGPNGAGKTSTMKMVACSSPVSEGELSVMGMNPRVDASRIKARLGVIPQQDNLDTDLTVRENLLMYARYFDIPRGVAQKRAMELLEFVQLSERADANVESLSGGMKRRLTIARSLINDPDLLLLDEPTTGLDPQARHVIWDRLYRLKRKGVTLILTTHYMDEAEQLCDRLVVMDKGKIVAEGSPRQLIEQHSTREVLELRLSEDWVSGPTVLGPTVLDPQVLRNAASDGMLAELAVRTERLQDRVLLYTDDGERALEKVRARDIAYETAFVRRSTLEDVFLRLTGRSLVD